jgi:hypothetical protein
VLARSCWPNRAGPIALAQSRWPNRAGPVVLARSCWPGRAGVNPLILLTICKLLIYKEISILAFPYVFLPIFADFWRFLAIFGYQKRSIFPLL